MAGNSNSGRRPKPFDEALKIELLAAGSDHKALRIVAQQLIAMAQSGDMQAIKELADRSDGKVPQAIVGDDDHDPMRLVHRIERLIVDPATDTDSSGIPTAS